MGAIDAVRDWAASDGPGCEIAVRILGVNEGDMEALRDVLSIVEAHAPVMDQAVQRLAVQAAILRYIGDKDVVDTYDRLFPVA